MGVSSVVRGIVDALMRDNSANPRTLRAWGRRAIKIGEHLDQCNDTERQRALQTTVTTIALELDHASGQQLDSLSTKIEPVIQSERAKIVLRGDEALNQFQAPPSGHSEAMRKAAKLDSRELFAQIEGLREAEPEVIREIMRPIGTPGTTGREAVSAHSEPRLSQCNPSTFYQPDPFKSTDSAEYPLKGGEPSSELQRQEMMYAEIMKKFQAMLESGSREPTIVIHMSSMGRDDAEVITQLISFKDTFADLSNIILEKDLSLPLPDFWIKRNCGTKNRATNSGVWWEWQRPNIRVFDALPKVHTEVGEMGVGVKMVVEVGEYVVILVKKDERECEMPIEIPRALRKPALAHFQEVVFPTDVVGKVVELETGRDVSRVVFDGNTFYHKTNPLFVEVRKGNLVGEKGKGTIRTTNILFPDNQSMPGRKRKHEEREEANTPATHMLVGERFKHACTTKMTGTTGLLPSMSATMDDTRMDES